MARVRFEYRPPTTEPTLVIAQILAIKVVETVWYHSYRILQIFGVLGGSTFIDLKY